MSNKRVLNMRRTSVYEPARRRVLSRPSIIRSATSPPVREERLQQQQEKQKEEGIHYAPGSNIRVYVRCRSRNQREIDEKSSVVISTLGAKGKEVILSNPSNPLSHPKKTYNFDQVFGAESDQETIFDAVGKSYIQEMLEGYNCTVFAYGQTGTGKTYTMSGDINILGDLESQDKILLGEHAGIIPRVLVDLFKQLSQETDEYSVKISFLELYNERLKDLLAENESTEENIRIFDNYAGLNNNKHSNNTSSSINKQTVKTINGSNSSSSIMPTSSSSSITVKGMEEIYIKSANEGLDLLMGGSLKRKVAATKCNDLSSRSHTVFTIITNVARTDPVSGEQYIKIGKLNLVDLAGSENINRSGAENKRAQEAGLINKSLLTLGRVINALVDHSQHIPYRESKLTRLLQDSLGGRTKTCIIATISPAKISMDETISTLEYATRAKSIKNTPQVNQSMSKDSCLVEYIHEIERLRLELKASRQKEGMYITQDQFDLYESNSILVEEQKVRIQNMEEQIKRFKEKYVEQTELNKKSEKKLEESEQLSAKLGIQKKYLLETFEKYQNSCDQYVERINDIHSGNVALIDALGAERNDIHGISIHSANVISSVLEVVSKQANDLSDLCGSLEIYNSEFKRISTSALDGLESNVVLHEKAAIEELSSIELSKSGLMIENMHASLVNILMKLQRPWDDETSAIYSSHRSIIDQCSKEVCEHVALLESSFLELFSQIKHNSTSGYEDLQQFGDRHSDETLKIISNQRQLLTNMEDQLHQRGIALKESNDHLLLLQKYFQEHVTIKRGNIFRELFDAIKHAENRQMHLDAGILEKCMISIQESREQLHSEHITDVNHLAKQGLLSLSSVEGSVEQFKQNLGEMCREKMESLDNHFESTSITESFQRFTDMFSKNCDENSSEHLLQMANDLHSKILSETTSIGLEIKNIIDETQENILNESERNKTTLESVFSNLHKLCSSLLQHYKENFDQISETQANTMSKHRAGLKAVLANLENSNGFGDVRTYPVLKVEAEKSVVRELPKLSSPRNYKIFRDVKTISDIESLHSPSRNHLMFNPSTPVPVPDQPLPKVLVPRSINSTAKRSTTLPIEAKKLQLTNSQKNNNLKRRFTTDLVLKTEENGEDMRSKKSRTGELEK